MTTLTLNTLLYVIRSYILIVKCVQYTVPSFSRSHDLSPSFHPKFNKHIYLPNHAALTLYIISIYILCIYHSNMVQSTNCSQVRVTKSRSSQNLKNYETITLCQNLHNTQCSDPWSGLYGAIKEMTKGKGMKRLQM